MMRLGHLLANDAWVVMFGDPARPESCDIIPLGDEPRFYATRAAAIAAANRHGLHVDRQGELTAYDCADEVGSCSNVRLIVQCHSPTSTPATVCSQHAQGLTLSTYNRLVSSP